MRDKKVTLISADEYFMHKDVRDSKEKRKIPDSWLVNIAGILMVISGILSIKYCSIFLTFFETETFAAEMCWLGFQIVVTVPTFASAISIFTRRKFQYAMAGAAMSISTTIVLGVIVLLLLYWGVDEFEKYEEYED